MKNFFISMIALSAILLIPIAFSPEELFGDKSKYDNFVSPKELIDGSS